MNTWYINQLFEAYFSFDCERIELKEIQLM